MSWLNKIPHRLSFDDTWSDTKRTVSWGLILLLLSGISTAYGQQLDQVGQSKALQLSGGLSANQIFYAMHGSDARRDPYTYFLTGDLNLSLYGWSAPVSFTLSNQQASFQQPFNQYSLHPSYKWVTLHAGYTSMNFSPYTLNGHTFLGGGVDVTPGGRWSGSVMYGRLQKAVPVDTAQDATALPAFRRMGGGAKLTYRYERDQVSLIFFRAADDVSSLTYDSTLAEVLPEENTVVSVSGTKSLGARVSLSAEVASSALTRDRRALKGEQNYFPMFQHRASTVYRQAYKGGINYQGNHYTLGLGYERVDPGYRTLGAYYFNQDLENITVNTTTALFANKVNLSLNVGLQRNNLRDDQLTGTRRTIGSINLGYTASDRLNFTGNYSNFQTFTNVRPVIEQLDQLTPFDNLDTLNYWQVAQSASLSTQYVLSPAPEHRQQLSTHLSYQQSSDQQGEGSAYVGTRFLTGNTAYSLQLSAAQLNLTVGANYNRSIADTLVTVAAGPLATVSRSWFQKTLRTSLSANYNQTQQAAVEPGHVATLRSTNSYTLRKRHALTLNVVVMRRSTAAQPQSLTELTATLGYRFRFSTQSSQP